MSEDSRILMGENNELNRIVAEGLLAIGQYTVDFAGSINELLNKAASGKYRLLIIDEHLPPEGGFTAVSQLQGTPALAGLAVIMMVSGPAERQKAEALGLGALLKPLDADALLAIVKSKLATVAAPSPVPGPTAHQSATEGSDGRPIVDFEDGVKRVAGNKGLFQKLLKRIADDLPSNFTKMQEAIDGNDMEALRVLAHTLKGSSGNLSITYLQEGSLALENAAKNNDPADALKCLEELKSHGAAYLAALDTYLAA